MVEQIDEKRKLERARLLTKQSFKENSYEFDDSITPFNGNPLEAKTITDIISCLEAGSADIEANVIGVNKESQIINRKIGKDEFLESAKQDTTKLKFKESVDAFAYDADQPSSAVGADFIPLLGGPFNKQQYMKDYLKGHSTAFFYYHHDPFANAVINMTRDFTLGRGFSVNFKNKTAQAMWDAFAEVNKLDEVMDNIAAEMSIYGEVMLWWLPNKQTYVAYQVSAGQMPPKGVLPRFRLIDPSVIWEIVTYPEDISRVLYYQWVAACLHGDTKIACLDGEDKTIRELAESWDKAKIPVPIYSYDIENKKVIPAFAHSIIKTGIKRCVKVILDSGDEIIASYDHPFLTRDGEYIWAENLEEGQSLMPLYRDIGKNGYERIYQPELKMTQNTHRMVAENLWDIDDGYVIHHEDGDKKNNNPENLKIILDKDHRSNHAKELWQTESYKNKVNEARNASMQSEEYRSIMSNLKKGFKLTPEQESKRLKTFKENIKSSEAFNKMNAINSKIFSSKEFKEKNSIRLKSLWDNPDYVESQKQKLRDAWIRRKEKMANNHKVVSVIPFGEHEVYDLTVEGTHNFALSCGVFTHNTQYQIYTGRDKDRDVPSTKFIFQQIPAEQVDHFKINVVSNEKRGRSDLYPCFGYFKRLRDSVNYAIIGMQKNAAWAIDTSIDGDQTDIDSYVASQESMGTIPPAGSEFVHSTKVVRTHLANSSAGGKGGVPAFDWALSCIAAGTGFPISYFGTHLSGTSTRASAIVSTEPIAKKIEKRQMVYERIVKIMAKRLLEPIGITDVPEVTFPQVISQDSSAMLKDIAGAQMQGWISKERAAEMAAKELNITTFKWQEEQDKMSSEPNVGNLLTNPLTTPSMSSVGSSSSAVTSDERKSISDSNGY